MPITDIDFEVTLHTTQGTQQCLNVWHYRKQSAHVTGDAQNLAAAFNVTVVNAIATMLNSQVSLGLIGVINLADPTDYYVQESAAVNGAISSTSPGPRFLAYSFQQPRTRRDGRHGYKRFVGVSEELVDANGMNPTGALIAAIPNVASAISQIITSGGSSYRPMIPKSVLTTMPDLSKKYILTDLFPMGTAIYQGLTTQNTRKR